MLPGERVERALRGDVRRVPGIDAELPAHGGQVEDAAAVAGRDHRAHRRLGRQERRPQVQVDDAIPFGLGVVLGGVERRAGAAADRVHEDVEPPEAPDRLVDGAVGIGLRAHVADHREGLGARCGDGALGVDEALARASHGDDVRAHGGERLARPQADAAGGSGDHRDTAVQPESPELIHGSPSLGSVTAEVSH